MDEYDIKYIVGHSIDDITEKVYAERELDWFKEEMEKYQRPRKSRPLFHHNTLHIRFVLEIAYILSVKEDIPYIH